MRTDRTVPNNEPDIIIRDNKQGKCVLKGLQIPGDRNVIKKEAENILKYKKPHNSNSAHVECENKSDTGNNRGDWDHFKIGQTVPDQHSAKGRIKVPAKNSHSGHCTQTAESAGVKAQNIFHGRNNITCSTHDTYKIAAKMYTLETWFVSDI